MKNKEKYYYPFIEDIRIGWEGEVNWSLGYSDEYVKEVVKLMDETGAYLEALGELTIAMDDGYAEARTPFLTKEQIEAEGWIHIGGFWWEWPVKNTIEVEEFSNRTLDFRLNFSGADKYLIIKAYERNSFDWETVFAGPCPTINELRTLMRWFKIKKDEINNPT
jgi:hypothetical protein